MSSRPTGGAPLQIVSIVGARPQFIKAGPLSRALRAAGHREYLVHTGQHYDAGMSDVFFEELGIPAPDVNLGVGSGPHGVQTAAMLQGLDPVLVAQRPDAVVIYGDTNSTLAGAVAAAKLLIPIVHVEAGLRSFNRRMPEEINRIVADRLATVLLCPSATAMNNLAAEGIDRGCHLVGDIMRDALDAAAARAASASRILERLALAEGAYCLATVHRAENTDDPGRLAGIVAALAALPGPIVFPVHPRTRKCLALQHLSLPDSVIAIDPVGYLDMVRLERGARLILTDSGGIQKEAYWLRVPCVTLRDETEWVETVQADWNRLAGADPARICAAASDFPPPAEHPDLYGDGRTTERCVAALASDIRS